jgi:hypothetical protein
MATGLGTMSGVAEVRGPDGQVKSTFTFETHCTQEQAEQLARDLSVKLEDHDHGNHAR